MVVWHRLVGVDDPRPAAVPRDRPLRDGGVPERGLSSSPASQLSGPALFRPRFVLGNSASGEGLPSAAAPVLAVPAQAVAAVCVVMTADAEEAAEIKLKSAAAIEKPVSNSCTVLIINSCKQAAVVAVSVELTADAGEQLKCARGIEKHVELQQLCRMDRKQLSAAC